MATSVLQLETNQFKDGLRDLYAMDRFQMLAPHLKRLSDSGQALADSGFNNNTVHVPPMFSKLQTQLTDYYHFLSRLDSLTRDYISEAEKLETQYSNRPEVYVHY